MSDTDEILKLETQNIKRIERLEIAVSEIKEDIAGLPGKILQAIGGRQQDKTWQWAFGVICSFALPVFSLVFVVIWSVWTINTQHNTATAELLKDHTFDKHPTRVEKDVAKVESLANDNQFEIEKLHKITDAHIDRERIDERWRGRIDERTELTLRGLIAFMELGGKSGREIAETKGTMSEAIQSLRDQLNGRH